MIATSTSSSAAAGVISKPSLVHNLLQVLQRARTVTLPVEELAGMYGRQVAWKDKIVQRWQRAQQLHQEAEEAACTFHPNMVGDSFHCATNLVHKRHLMVIEWLHHVSLSQTKKYCICRTRTYLPNPVAKYCWLNIKLDL